MSSFQFVSPLILQGDPVDSLEAATKQYVDTAIGVVTAPQFTAGELAKERLPALTGDVTSPAGSNSLTLKNASSTVAGVSSVVTVGGRGRVTDVLSFTDTYVPNLSWNKITSGKPTDAAGYGITDAVVKSGSTVTGNVNVTTTPTADLHLVNKAYVESAVAAAGGGSSGSGIAAGQVVRKTTTSSAGYLRCNGGILNKTDYAALYSAIGDAHTKTASSFETYGTPWVNQYNINDIQGGTLSAWVDSASVLPVGILVGSVAVTKNFVHYIGGWTTARVATVYTAPISGEGIIGPWATTEPALPVASQNHGCVMVRDRIYVTACDTASGLSANIYSIDVKNNGSLGVWRTETSTLATAVSEATVVAYKNYIYVIGGVLPTTNLPTDKIQRLEVLADGSLGPAVELPVRLPYTVRVQPQVAMVNNKLYIIGGSDGSANRKDVHSADISDDGWISSWTTSSSLPVTLGAASVYTTKTHVFTVGGVVDGALSADIYVAAINTDGTLGTWAKSAVSLPAARQNFPMVCVRNKLLVIGGSNGVSYLASIIHTVVKGGYNDYLFAYPDTANTFGYGKPWQNQYDINTTQSAALAAFSANGTISSAMTFGKAAVTRNRVFYVGGDNGSGPVTTVSTATLDSYGNIGTWSASTPLLAATSRHELIVTKRGFLVIGGYSAGAPTNKIMMSKISPLVSSGPVGWSYVTDLPVALMDTHAVRIGDKLYVIGGENSAGAKVSSVYVTSIDDGCALGEWTLYGNIPEGVSAGALTVVGNKLYLFGGKKASGASSAVYRCDIQANDTLGAWSTAQNLPEACCYQQVYVARGKVYLVGGADAAGTASGNTYSIATSALGTATSWTTTASGQTLTQTQLVAAYNQLWLLGGRLSGAVTNSRFSAAIVGGRNDYGYEIVPQSCKTDSGTPWYNQYDYNSTLTSSTNTGAWSTTAYALPIPLRDGQLFVTKSKVYYVSGKTTGNQFYTHLFSNKIYRNDINNTGNLATGWTDMGTTPFDGIARSAVVLTRNKVYFIGGEDINGLLNTVHIGSITDTGNIGGWTTGPALPSTVVGGGAFVTGNYMYVIGQGTVYRSTISSDGTLSAWETYKTLPFNRVNFSLAVTGNAVNIVGGQVVSYAETPYDDPMNILQAVIDANGDLKSFFTVSTISIPPVGAKLLVARNVMYIFAGGSEADGTTQTGTLRCPINAHGVPTVPVAGTALNAGVTGGQVFVTSSRLYIVGGGNTPTEVTTDVKRSALAGAKDDYSSNYNPPAAIDRLSTTTFSLPDYSTKEVGNLYYFIKV